MIKSTGPWLVTPVSAQAANIISLVLASSIVGRLLMGWLADQGLQDETLILADVATKARTQVGAFVAEVLVKHMPKAKAASLATTLTDGRWTHDFPITVEMARGLGLPVTTDMPRTVYDLMDLYPQGGRGRPSVLYVPLRPSLPERGESGPAAPINPPPGPK